jgi:hypothetical protein
VDVSDLELRRLIKYKHLVATYVIFHNVNTQTRILRQLVEEEGCALDSEVLAHLSPYITEHLNQFGNITKSSWPSSSKSMANGVVRHWLWRFPALVFHQ